MEDVLRWIPGCCLVRFPTFLSNASEHVTLQVNYGKQTEGQKKPLIWIQAAALPVNQCMSTRAMCRLIVDHLQGSSPCAHDNFDVV